MVSMNKALSLSLSIFYFGYNTILLLEILGSGCLSLIYLTLESLAYQPPVKTTLIEGFLLGDVLATKVYLWHPRSLLLFLSICRPENL